MDPSPAVRLHRRLATVALASAITLYVSLALFYASQGRYVFFAKTGIVPVLCGVAVLSGRALTFALDWALFLSGIALFDSFRGLVYAVTTRFDLPIHAMYAIRWDEALLGGKSLPVLLQRKLFDPPSVGAFERALVIVHGSHFVFWMVFGMSVWLYRRDEFPRFRRAVCLLMGLGLALYLIVPTVPPWMASDLHLIDPITHVTAVVYKTNLAAMKKAFDTNPVAAMPSLHTAFAVLCAIFGVHCFGRRAAPIVVYAATMLFSIAYLGEHYLVDIVGGVALAAIVFRLSDVRKPVRPALADVSDLAASRTTLAWHAAGAGAMLLLSEGIVQLCGVVKPAEVGPTVSFVEREMAGRSDLAHLTMADALERLGQREGARRELELALTELHDPEQIAEVRARLGSP